MLSRFRKTLERFLPEKWLKLQMFLVVFALLYLNIRFANRPDYEGIDSSLYQTAKSLALQNDLMIQEMLEDSASFRPQTVYDTAINIRRKTAAVLAVLEDGRQRLVRLHDARPNIRLMPAASAARKEEDRIIDSIQIVADSYWVFLERRDIGFYRDVVSSQLPLRPLTSKYARSNEPHPLKLLLTSIPGEHIGPFLSAVKNLVLLSQELITRVIFNNAAPGCGLRFDAIFMLAVPAQTHYFEGQSAKAEIFLGDYNKAITPVITLNAGKVDKIESGLVWWSNRDKVLGWKEISGTASITIKSQTTTRPWSFRYFVIAPGVSAELKNSNICYSGIATPVSISVPGYRADKLNLKVEGAAVRKMSDSTYEIVPKAGAKQLFAYVNGENSEGEMSTVAGRKLIVVEAPLPVVSIINAEEGRLPADRFRGISARAADEDIGMNYEVLSYELTLVHDKEAVGPVTAGGEVGTLLSKAAKGDKLIVDNISVRGSNGVVYHPSFVSCVLE